MYGPSRTASGVADVDALSSSLKGLPVEAAFTQVGGRSNQPIKELRQGLAVLALLGTTVFSF